MRWLKHVIESSSCVVLKSESEKNNSHKTLSHKGWWLIFHCASVGCLPMGHFNTVKKINVKQQQEVIKLINGMGVESTVGVSRHKSELGELAIWPIICIRSDPLKLHQNYVHVLVD